MRFFNAVMCREVASKGDGLVEELLLGEVLGAPGGGRRCPEERPSLAEVVVLRYEISTASCGSASEASVQIVPSDPPCGCIS